MDELIKQVKELMQTVQVQGQRLDQALKLLDETLASSRDLTSKLQIGIDALQVAEKALERSLEASDAQVDDLATVTQALQQIAAESSEG